MSNHFYINFSPQNVSINHYNNKKHQIFYTFARQFAEAFAILSIKQ